MRARGHESKGNMMIVTILWVVIWMSLVNRSIQFLVEYEYDHCLVYPPCTCTNLVSVKCDSRDLSTFPRFRVTNVSFTSRMSFMISGNNLTTIPSDSFINLTVSNTTSISIFLMQNNLNSIATYAFNGIADREMFLQLQDNRFTAIPSALGQLTKLQYLNLEDNPIITLSAYVLHALSRTLTWLHLDLKYAQGWPIELNYLHALTDLYLTNVQQHSLDYDAFDGFKKTLQQLHIINSKLENIPFSVCHLENLREFYFLNNTNIRINSRVFEPCANPLSHVDRVRLDGDNLRYIPDVFETFQSIDSDTIPSNTSLGALFLNRNNFTRIPTAVNKLTSLVTLSMKDNQIVSVEGSDLKDLINLSFLYLDNNPIEYIASQAFTTNRALGNLYLSNTKLRILPASLTGLKWLRNVYLFNNPTVCTCKISYLGALNWNYKHFYGTCDQSSLRVETYIKEDLPRCP